MINSKDIIQQGELAKYRIDIDRTGFSMTADDFQVLLTWGMRGESLTIPKSAMLQNEDGATFFQFDTTPMVGRVAAECTYYVPDSDCASGLRPEVERQPLCFVTDQPRQPRMLVDDGVYDGRHVSYQRQTRSGLKSLFQLFILRGGQFLADVSGLPFLVRKKN